MNEEASTGKDYLQIGLEMLGKCSLVNGCLDTHFASCLGCSK